MRSANHSRLLLCSLAVTFAACGGEAGQPTTPSDHLPTTPGIQLAAGGGNCGMGNSHPSGSIIDSVPTPPSYGIAVREDGLAYFTEPDFGGIGITNTKTRTVTGFIATGSVPTGVAFSPDGNTAYVANQGDQTVSIIDATTSAVVGSIFTPDGSPLVVEVSPDGTQLFVATASTTVEIVDVASRQVVRTAQVGFLPNAFTTAPDGRIMYVSAAFGGSVSEIDMFTGDVLRTFDVGGVPQGMAVTKDGKRLYVGNESGFLTEITLLQGTVTATIPLVGGAFGVGVTPDGVQAFVGIPSAGVVQVFNLQSHHLAQTINVHGNPRRIGFSQLGHIGAVANLAGYVTFVR
ncbi:MAG TPA: hypothetical protein VJN95_14850 [Gemmatimonadales bacterium]|nr:hypothetical protein [Gemmatimonadales bacterium]